MNDFMGPFLRVFLVSQCLETMKIHLGCNAFGQHLPTVGVHIEILVMISLEEARQKPWGFLHSERGKCLLVASRVG